MGGGPQLFISPAGEPFRAPPGAPTPSRPGSTAPTPTTTARSAATSSSPTLRFFAAVDTDKNGVIDGFEVSNYETRIAPEIVGLPRAGRFDAARPDGPGSWRRPW
ncbi:hypothetical protein ACRAWD_19235 [Caulobacter segnis]